MRRLLVGLAIVSLAALAFTWAWADDQDIAKEITERLKREQLSGHLRDFNINLKVADGHVLLKGHVASAEQQQLALELARGAKGVKQVVNDLQIQPAADTAAKPAVAAADAPPEPAAVDDKLIGEQITAELKRRKEAGELKGFGLALAVNDGVVVLRGRVASHEQLQLAADIAKNTAGVRDVENHVVVVAELAPEATAAATPVSHPVAEKPAAAGDDQIAQRIATAVRELKQAGKLKGFDIDLSVQDGVVALTGQIADAEQLQLALDAVRQTAGVKEVVNQLVIAAASPGAPAAEPAPDTALAADKAPASPAPAAPATAPAAAPASGPSDQELAQAIAAAVKRQQDAGKLKGFNFDIAVKDGVATYSGRVSNAEHVQMALDLARQTAGVRDVVNQLVVAEMPAKTASPAAEAVAATPPPTDDNQIAARIGTALNARKSAGQLHGFDIDVAVKEGVVTYSGQVSNKEQMQLALDLARKTEGVRHVVNHLAVVDATPKPMAAPPAEGLAAAPVQTAELERPMGAAPLSGEPTAPAAGDPMHMAAYHTAAAAGDPAGQDQRIGEELTRRLEAAKRSGNLRGFGISVRVDQGNVWLQGRVADAEQRQMAASVARTVPGVGRITNELSVASAPRDAVATRSRNAEVTHVRSPLEIAQQLDERLRAEEQRGTLQGTNLEVQVEQDHVWLKGRVANEDQRELAIEIARRVPGVKKVMDAVTVMPADSTVVTAAANSPQGPISVAAPTIPGGYAMMPAMEPTPAIAGYAVAGPQVVGQPLALNQPGRPLGPVSTAAYVGAGALAAPIMAIGQAVEGAPAQLPGPGYAQVPARYDHPYLPGYAWPTYAAYPNYAAVTYPKQYSPTAWPYIGPFYPYPQVPLGWRKVTLRWDDGWWQLNFKSK